MARSGRYTSNYARQLGFASGLEVKTSEQLDKLKRSYHYETDECRFRYHLPLRNGGIVDKNGDEVLKLDKGDKIVQFHQYTCDFMIFKSDETPMFIETKGYFKSKDRSKHQALKKLYPNLDLRIIFQSDGKVSSKTRYSQWATRQGISYHCLTTKEKKDGCIIPLKWLEE